MPGIVGVVSPGKNETVLQGSLSVNSMAADDHKQRAENKL